MRTLLAIALVAVLTRPVSASIVYENPWNSAATDAGAFSQPGQRLAGEFLLGAAANVVRATWYGTMFDIDPLNTGDTWNFDVVFYSDAAGLPNSTLASASVVANVTDTGIDVQSERAYQFDAIFPTVSLSAGVTYWFSVVNTGTADTFRWTGATTGTDSAIFTISGLVPYVESNRTPLNFALRDDGVPGAVPEPATVAMWSLLALTAGAGAYRRRSQHGD
jgi:hypothetical protein